LTQFFFHLSKVSKYLPTYLTSAVLNYWGGGGGYGKGAEEKGLKCKKEESEEENNNETGSGKH
jgi:hypothetical protein